MEPLFSAVICGCNAGLFREALHEVFIPRIQRGNDSFAANVLGARGALLLVLSHFFEDGRWGSLVETTEKGQGLTAEDQLFILMQSALYLTATRGLGAPDARICYERAEPLCHSLNRPVLLHVALMGQWRYSLMHDKLTATIEIAKRVYSLAEEQKNAALMIGACRALAGTFYFSGDFESAQKHAVRGVEIWCSGGVQTPVEEVGASSVVCLCYVALTEWHFGEIISSQTSITEAISLAKELNDMDALALALQFLAYIARYNRNSTQAERVASDLIELSTRYNFSYWLTIGTMFRGWARSASGERVGGMACLEDGISNYRSSGAVLAVPFYLGLKAEALHLAQRTSEALEVISEAEASAERSAEGSWCAELHRLRGVFLATMGADETQIEASFQEAIRIAKEQMSVSLEKGAEETYAEYRRQKASGSEGRAFRLPLW
jgi:adenylate cyclase